MSNIIDSILISGTTYTLQGSGGGGGNPTVELTQAQYDALVSAGTVSADTYYIITDAEAIDVNDYVKTSAFTAYSASVDTTLQGKQPTLTAGSGITIDSANTISCTVTGGGTTYTAGNGISISSDTISLGVAITGVSTSSLKLNGSHSNNNKGFCTIAGANNVTNNTYEFVAGGRYNYATTSSTNFGDSGNTVFSVGNGESTSHRHSAISLRQNGDLYVVDVDNTDYANYYQKPMKRLQDYIQYKIVKLSQADYDALVSGGTVDANTVYFITNSNS